MGLGSYPKAPNRVMGFLGEGLGFRGSSCGSLCEGRKRSFGVEGPYEISGASVG